MRTGRAYGTAINWNCSWLTLRAGANRVLGPLLEDLDQAEIAGAPSDASSCSAPGAASAWNPTRYLGVSPLGDGHRPFPYRVLLPAVLAAEERLHELAL